MDEIEETGELIVKGAGDLVEICISGEGNSVAVQLDLPRLRELIQGLIEIGFSIEEHISEQDESDIRIYQEDSDVG